jgi:hypothetical protein
VLANLGQLSVVTFRYMPKHIVTVGFRVPGSAVEALSFNSDDSILGAEIVVFHPTLAGYSALEEYGGQRLISAADSDDLRRHTLHWRSELATALEHGRTVFLFLGEISDCYVHTGRREVSGSGKSPRVTNIVEPYRPYSSVPAPGLADGMHRSLGDAIKTSDKLGALSSYWSEFGPYSYYDVYLDQITVPCLLTKTGDKAVGGLIRSKGWKGTMVLLPLVNFDGLVREREKQILERAKGKNARAAAAAKKKAESSVGRQFMEALVEVDKMVRLGADRTPAPQWSKDETYSLREELVLGGQIAGLESKIAHLRDSLTAARANLEAAGNLKGLLYETGKPLESAVLDALNILGFNAENYKDAESEFDALFVDPDGNRMLGEAEGKTEKAINIDKLDQLNRNVQEEFAKRADASYAKGVLFGNAFRLAPPSERAEFFTEKCLAGAKRLGFALVKTPDLFSVARYLNDNADAEYARRCRSEILLTVGAIVVFPPLPVAESGCSVAVDARGAAV